MASSVEATFLGDLQFFASFTLGYIFCMAMKPHTFMLRIKQRKPDGFPMNRIGEYITEFAALLGSENNPVFRGIKTASTGLKAYTSPERTPHCRARIKEAKSDPESKPAKHLHLIEQMLSQDSIAEAEMLDAKDNVIYVVFGEKVQADDVIRLYQEALVDGVVTGLVGADETMHLHFRDQFDRDLKLNVRNETLARDLLKSFRFGTVRIRARGTWIRHENGWSPEASRCTVQSFEALDGAPLRQILNAAAKVKNNGWREMSEPIETWSNLRGIH